MATIRARPVIQGGRGARERGGVRRRWVAERGTGNFAFVRESLPAFLRTRRGDRRIERVTAPTGTHTRRRLYGDAPKSRVGH